ncbi:MAG TPA: ribonuclease J [Aestuariivirgaceae bacterium]|nr:ribonuclease J [Aestuariivirgaceae bacterium]
MSKLHRSAPRRFTELVFLPLGGTGEIGMNCSLYGLGAGKRRQWIMVDLGVKFGDERDPGIDVILPDTGFIEADRRNLLGIVLTHAHEDHMGAAPWLWRKLRAPIYCTPFTAELLKGKLIEANLLDEVKLNVVPMGARFPLGPFDIEYVAVTHSLPEPNAIAIRTPLGTVVHTGDWKIDRQPTIPPDFDETRMREIGNEGVRAVVGDSTNVLREGFSPSESEVEASLARIIKTSPGRVAITTFASHVGRFTSAIRAARATGREVVMAGRAMRNVVEAARSVGLLKDSGPLLDEDAFGFLPRDKTLVLCTGSQGEPRAAMSRIAEDTHPNIALEAGDIAILSSRVIPGNEKAVAAVVNALAWRGVEIIGGEEALVQTSGHPRQGEIKLLYSWLKPEVVVPVHGEMRHLKRHESFARECGVAEAVAAVNGDVVRLAPGPAAIIDKVTAGRLHVDGKLIVPALDGPAKLRRKLSYGGIVMVSLVLDEAGDLIGEPTILTDGLPRYSDMGEPFDASLLDKVDQAISAMPQARRREDGPVIEIARGAVRRQADALWGKKPVCRVVVHRV